MRIDHFAITCEDDPAGRPSAAQPMGTGEALSAAEPVGIVGGHLAPAPAAAGPEPVITPDVDDEPQLGGARLALGGPVGGSGSGEGSVAVPYWAPRPVDPPGGADHHDDRGDPFLALGPGDAAMDRFVADYLQLLDGRLDTIRRCLADSDIEGARVAVLSLESSSLMLGGGSLADRLGELRSELDLAPGPRRNALLALVETAASVFRVDLQTARG